MSLSTTIFFPGLRLLFNAIVFFIAQIRFSEFAEDSGNPFMKTKCLGENNQKLLLKKLKNINKGDANFSAALSIILILLVVKATIPQTCPFNEFQICLLHSFLKQSPLDSNPIKMMDQTNQDAIQSYHAQPQAYRTLQYRTLHVNYVHHTRS